MKRYRLGEICEIVSGSTPKTSIQEYWDGDIKWITPAEITDDSYIITDTVRKITKLGVEKNGLSSFPAGTVILSSRAPIGKVAIAGCDMYCNQGFKNLICSKIINNKYLYWFLKGKKDYLNKLGRGATFKEISKQIVAEIEIELPSLEEQVLVANNLLNIKRVIDLKKKEIDLFDKLIKARFVEMFGDPVKNPFGLPLKKLSELGTLDRGRSKHRPRNAPELLNGPYPLIQTGEVAAADLYITEYHNTYSEIGLKQSKMWKAGTLCITIAANIAQTAIMSFDACFPDSVVGFVPGNKMSALYLHYWFGFFQKILEEQAPQVAQKNINLKILSDLKVVVPVREQLKAFETFVTQIDKSKVEVQRSLEKTQMLFDSLMQQYFG